MNIIFKNVFINETDYSSVYQHETIDMSECVTQTRQSTYNLNLIALEQGTIFFSSILYLTSSSLSLSFYFIENCESERCLSLALSLS